MVNYIAFRPLPGFSSPHAQTILTHFIRGGNPPRSTPLLIPLADGDTISCELSTPPSWNDSQKTVVMVHGLGGSHASSYMIRLGRKLYSTGYRVVRVNLRGCGSGKGLARRPYHAGISSDIHQILQNLKQTAPRSPIILIGFSLGANISLKVAAELGDNPTLLQHVIAVCPPLDFIETYKIMCSPNRLLYHMYYLNLMIRQGKHLIGNARFSSIFEFDNAITAPMWGFENALDYYKKSSSRYFIPEIKQSCSILVTADDPFIDHRPILDIPIPPTVKAWVSPKGGHMGFFGWAGKQHRCFFLDQLVMEWVDNC